MSEQYSNAHETSTKLSADRQAHNTNAITGDNQIEYKSTADAKLNHEQPIELYLIASGDGNNASHRYPRKRYCRRDLESSAHCKACINKATRENDSTDMWMECRKQKRQASKYTVLRVDKIKYTYAT